jgi:dTMP kinase
VAYLPYPLAKLLYHLFTLFLPTSDYMFFLDLEPEESLGRMSKRDEEEMFENREDLIKVRKKALKLAKDWNIIDSSGNVNSVKKDIEAILDDLG